MKAEVAAQIGVYPRVYGGTLVPDWAKQQDWGLSPRVRGNRSPSHLDETRQGSIPACTGEPVTEISHDLTDGVYPRVYGGTSRPARQTLPGGGLSPRVRGNRAARGPHRGIMRSIPACTGEPLWTWTRTILTGVYPRVYGGTSDTNVRTAKVAGLSPRVRGNHARPGTEARVLRSIPACTGEPPEAMATDHTEQVYPRVYGGTTVRA